MLRFLADESCDFAAVRALRTEGFDVLSVAEALAGADDVDVIALALRERRILLTEDKDFGQLVYAAGSKAGHRFEAKQARWFLHAAAYRLRETLRRDVCRATPWARATMATIPWRFLKLGARV